MGDKEIESKLTFGIYDAETGEYKELGSTDAIPQFAKGGIIQPVEFSSLGECEVEKGEWVIPLKEKYFKWLARSFRRAITGSNNRRKMRGLPMYRYYRR